MNCRILVVVLALAAVVPTTPARAQDTAIKSDPEANKGNAEAQAPERDSDEADVGLVEKAKQWAEDKRLGERLEPKEGFYARFGGMTTGSGFAAGPGYRRYFNGDDIFTDVSAAISTKAYKAFDAKARWLRLWDDRVEFWTDFRYRDYPEEDFFGLGLNSSRAARTSYSIESTDIVGRGLVNLARWLRVGVDVGYFRPDVGHGADDSAPSIEDLFSDVSAPGLTDQPSFLHNTLFAEVDYRDHRGNPTTGGFYRASFGTWEDQTLQAYDHHRFDAEAAQFLPVAPKQVLAVRVGLSYVNNETGHRVPFYFLPYVGGSDTVRGYREFRFRDENILFVNAEYRLRVSRFLHVAPFIDAGEVRSNWEDIGPRNLKTAYGIGFRAGTEDRVFVRLDIGTGGNEGTRVYFKFGPSF
jgi:outer membrane protein assembly factor BamA